MQALDDKMRYRRNNKYTSKISKLDMKMIKIRIYWYTRWSISMWLCINTSFIWLKQNCNNEHYKFAIEMFCFRKHEFLVVLQKHYFQEMQFFVEIIYPKTVYERKTQSLLLTIYVLWKNLLFKSLRVFLWFNFLWYYAAAYATNRD